MAQSTFHLDDQAFNVSTDGVIQPRNIPMLQVEEEDAVDNPQIFQPLPGAQQEEQAADPDTQDMLLDWVMALASDLHTFREFESYRFDRVYSDSDSDIPEDYSSEDEYLETTGRPGSHYPRVV